MGTSPRSSQNVHSEKLYSSQLGKDSDGVTENFQFHDIVLANKQINLTASEQFFRESFRPMHLLTFKFFNNMLDQFVKWAQVHTCYTQHGWEFDDEVIPYELFIEYFTYNSNHLLQIQDKESPMRKVLLFDNVFVIKQKIQKKPLEQIGENQQIINEVIESMMDPQIMEELSEEQQQKYVQQQVKMMMELDQIDKEDEIIEEEVECIDLFALRVLSLIVCRGKPMDKAKFLVTLGDLHQGEQISKHNPRIEHALQHMMDFTSFMPNKFLSMHRDQDIYYKIMTVNKHTLRDKYKKKNNLKLKKCNSGTQVTVKTPLSGTKIQDEFEQKVIIPKDFFWNEEEIENNEQLFKLVFQTFHEQKYLEKVFPENIDNVTLKDFYQNFKGVKTEYEINNLTKITSLKSPINWFFSMDKMAFVTRQYLRKHYMLECFIIEKIDLSDDENSVIDVSIECDQDDSCKYYESVSPQQISTNSNQ